METEIGKLNTGTTRTVRAGTGAAHAKAILLGEHAVVYGAPALVVPVDDAVVTARVVSSVEDRIDSELFRGALADAPERLGPVVTAIAAARDAFGVDEPLAVTIDSTIPAERGLGSSAAVAAAIVAAIADAAGAVPESDVHHVLIQTAERVAHGTPSGLDARGVVADGPVWFASGDVEPLAVAAHAVFVIADTGVRGGTRKAVADVRAARAADPASVDALVETLAEAARTGRAQLESGDLPGLGATMDAAHAALSRLGVSSPELDALASAARKAGAFGAKLTGGGRGGCLIALAAGPQHATELAAALEAAGARASWTADVEASR